VAGFNSITQAKIGPPTFVLFTKQKKPLHFSFERFWRISWAEKFAFIGTPMRFVAAMTNAGAPRRCADWKSK